jgi:hypothetical protein
LERALDDTDERVRIHAAYALAKMTETKDKSIDVLKSVHASTVDPTVKEWAAVYLAFLETPPSSARSR